MPLHEKPHREMCDFLEDTVTSSKMMLVPRDCWKTSIGSTAFPLWMVMRAYLLDGNPAYRCLIDSSTTRLSSFVVSAIRDQVQHNDKFIEVFGEQYDRRGDRQEGLKLKFRTGIASGVREPNFVPSGVNAAKTGLHFELMLMDDLVTKENARTADQRQKVYDHYRMMNAIQESDSGGNVDTMVVLIGTRYHDDDIYGRILKQDKQSVAEGQAPIFTTLIRAAVTDDGEYYFPGEPGKPGGLGQVALEKKKKVMGSLFWAQMMNDPNKEEAPFKAAQLRFKPIMEFPPLSKIRLTIDPAVKEDDVSHGDYSAMVVAGWDKWNQMWIVDAIVDDKLMPGKFIECMLHLATKWNVEHILIEDDGSMQAMEILWRREFQERGYSFPITRVPANRQQGKLNRWLDIQPYAERGGIRIAEEIPAGMKVEIADQWSRAPFATHDDFMDALAMQTMYLPVSFKEETGREMVNTGDSPVDVATLAMNSPSRSHSPFYGTLAERFPFLRDRPEFYEDPEPFEDFAETLEAIGS